MSDSLWNWKSAVLSRDHAYRWLLHRRLSESKSAHALFIMLNPSTADGKSDDPTIRRCLGYAARWGYGVLEVANLFGLRATDPRELLRHPDPVGPRNDEYVLAAIRDTTETGGIVVCAWGVRGGYHGRDAAVLRLIHSAGISPSILGLTRDGHPRHPLYMPASVKPRAWDHEHLSEEGADAGQG